MKNFMNVNIDYAHVVKIVKTVYNKVSIYFEFAFKMLVMLFITCMYPLMVTSEAFFMGIKTIQFKRDYEQFKKAYKDVYAETIGHKE